MARDVTLKDTIPSNDEIMLAIGSTLTVFVIGYGIFYKLKSKVVEDL